MQREDLKGKVFGKLTIISQYWEDGTGYSVCACECGKETTKRTDNLTHGATTSCGCYQKSIAGRYLRNPHSSYVDTKLYKVWSMMKDRCSNPNNKAYPNYGGRGITVCEEWKSNFEQFRLDMGDAPEGCTLDRIDNSKGYSASNCRWATRREQNLNKRDTIRVTVDGVNMTLLELSEASGISYNTLRSRIRLGWPEDKLTETSGHLITINGVTKNASQWADENNISRTTFNKRLLLGWEGESLLKSPESKFSTKTKIS